MEFFGLPYRPRYPVVSNMPDGDTLKHEDEEAHFVSHHVEDGADEVRAFLMRRVLTWLTRATGRD